MKVEMIVTHYEGTYIKDNEEREWHSFGIDFKLSVLEGFSEITDIRVKPNVKFPSEPRRRELTYHLLADVRWKLTRKRRDIIFFESYFYRIDRSFYRVYSK